MKTIKPLIICLCLVTVSACAFIAGRDEEGDARAPTLDVRFVESLRSQESLRGGGWSEPQAATSPATALQQPRSVFADDFRVYVVDAYTSTSIASPRIFVFDRTARTAVPVALPVLPSEGALVNPVALAVDGANVMWVADAQRGRVFGYDTSGAMVAVLGRAGELGKPTALAADNARGKLYIADAASHQVKIVSGIGSRMTVLEEPGGVPSEIRSPSGLAADREGNLYVLEAREKAVQVYDAAGTKVRVLGIPADASGAPLKPSGIAVDSDGHVYITDAVSNTILILDPAGVLLRTWGRTGNLIGDFWSPAGIFIDAHDRIYIADQMNGRVQIFQYVK